MRDIGFIFKGEKTSVKDYLRKRLGVSARSITELKTIEGGIRLNGKNARTVDFLNDGDILTLKTEDAPVLNEEKFGYKILYFDENYTVIEKPPYTTVYKSGKEERNINDVFIKNYPDFTFRPFYRLDKNTDGTLLIANNALIMQGTEIDKYYFAICSGKVPESGVIDEPISLEENSVIKRRCGFGGQDAVTEYKRVNFDGENSLVKIKLKTGRTHQIRVHFSYLGFPLIGDDLYGGKCDKIPRQALHCGVCKIVNKAIGTDVLVVSEFFDDFKKAFGKEISIKDYL